MCGADGFDLEKLGQVDERVIRVGEHHVEGVITQFGSRVIQGMLVCQKKIKKLSLLLLSLAG